MHIGLLTHYYPPEIGAAAIRLSRLAQAFVAEGHRVTVITGMPNYPEGTIQPAYRGKLFCREQIGGVDVLRAWVYASPRKSAISRILNQIGFALMGALRGTFAPRPDVLLVESHPLFVCLSAGWLKRIQRVPIVLNVSDLWPDSAVATGVLAPDSLLVRVAKPIERWAYRDAAQVIGMTEGVVSGIARYTQNVTLIQNGVDLTRFFPADEARRAAAKKLLGFGDAFIAVHIGNMSLTYDFEILLDAARAIPDMLLVFAGVGSQFEATRAKAASLPNVRFLGLLPHDHMPDVWAAADLCLIALRDHSVAGGTLPAKMYEAMATGTPVVAAIRGEGAEMLTSAGAGAAVPIGNSAAMTTAIERMRANAALRAEASKAGRRFAEQRFSVQNLTRSYLQILKSVL